MTAFPDRRPDPPEFPRCRRRQDPRPAAHGTGARPDRRVEVTCIDMAMPMVLLRAEDLGKTGHEPPADLDTDAGFMTRLERSAARPARSWAWATSPSA